MWLAIETAGDQASVAVGSSSGVRAETSISGARRHAAALVPLMQAALRESEATLDDIEGVLIADGPGSFTGLRVGASVAKALAHVRGLPLWSSSTLLVSAAGVACDEGERVFVVSEALRGEVYAASYRLWQSRVETLSAPAVKRPDELGQEYAAADTLTVCGYEGLANRLPSFSGRVVGAPGALPRAATLIGLLGRAGAMTRQMDPGNWEPEYGRPAEAQARWEAEHGRRLPDSTRAG
ncbi:MAG: tRNA (adenosine(37)-N6)-threonylcarbamoyltransferase complex dimerization subunit type 1 TsaB [Gemmatimonadota bacterium]